MTFKTKPMFTISAFSLDFLVQNRIQPVASIPPASKVSISSLAHNHSQKKTFLRTKRRVLSNCVG